jgi:hypothetical protein
MAPASERKNNDLSDGYLLEWTAEEEHPDSLKRKTLDETCQGN